MQKPTLSELIDAVEALCAELRLRDGCAMPADLLTLKQASFEFGKSNDTLRRWADDEGLGVKIGGRWLISRAVVIARKLSAA